MTIIQIGLMAHALGQTLNRNNEKRELDRKVQALLISHLRTSGLSLFEVHINVRLSVSKSYRNCPMQGFQTLFD